MYLYHICIILWYNVLFLPYGSPFPPVKKNCLIIMKKSINYEMQAQNFEQKIINLWKKKKLWDKVITNEIANENKINTNN